MGGRCIIHSILGRLPLRRSGTVPLICTPDIELIERMEWGLEPGGGRGGGGGAESSICFIVDYPEALCWNIPCYLSVSSTLKVEYVAWLKVSVIQCFRVECETHHIIGDR